MPEVGNFEEGQQEYSDRETMTLTASDVGTLDVSKLLGSEQGFTVTLPDRNNKESIKEAIAACQDIFDKRGVKTLHKQLLKYQRNARLTESMWQNVSNTTNYINGVRSTTQQKGDRKRSLRSDAQDFYNSLSTPALRLHCQLFGISYDSYNSIEEVVTVLVQKHIDMIAA